MKITFVLFASVVMVFLTESIHTNSGLITSTCKRTPHFDLCVSILGRSKVSDVETLALMAINVLKSQTIDLQNYVDKLIEGSHDPKLLKALNNCKSKYQFLLKYNIVEANKAVELGDPKFGVDAMNDAVIEIGTCESGFSSGGFASPLANQDKQLQDIAQVIAAIITILE